MGVLVAHVHMYVTKWRRQRCTWLCAAACDSCYSLCVVCVLIRSEQLRAERAWCRYRCRLCVSICVPVCVPCLYAHSCIAGTGDVAYHVHYVQVIDAHMTCTCAPNNLCPKKKKKTMSKYHRLFTHWLFTIFGQLQRQSTVHGHKYHKCFYSRERSDIC